MGGLDNHEDEDEDEEDDDKLTGTRHIGGPPVLVAAQLVILHTVRLEKK